MSVTHSEQIDSPRLGAGRWPEASATLELLKPITWFAPMWAFGCGVISVGGPSAERLWEAALGVLLAGPLVCAMSQAANDWCDRHVDAINEPNRPIPSGRVPGRWGLWIALIWTALSLGVAALLGPWVFGATLVATALAWAYSAEPIRLKRSGLWGPAAVGLCYEGVAWFTGAAASMAAAPGWPVVAVALLYSAGAHGIMTLNDFKAIEGDRAMGLSSLPVRDRPDRAARIALWTMIVPQIVVVALLLAWGAPLAAIFVTAAIGAQMRLGRRLLQDPKAHAPWFNATGTGLYVLGMLATAIALGGLDLGA